MGKVVTTHLVDGDPQGVKYAFISNKICQMFVIPRSRLDYLKDNKKLERPAFYVLLGEDETIKPQAYIGETENFSERVKDHNKNKDFWQKALVFVSKDSEMTKADVKYLEYKAIGEAKEANTFLLDENKQKSNEPNLPEHQKETMNEFFFDVKFLLAFVGCNLFEIFETVQDESKKHLFYVKSKDCDAKGFYSTSGFTILRGSFIEPTSTSSLKWPERDEMIKEYTIEKNGKLILNTDITFPNPSKAAQFCIGRPENGWLIWKDETKNTLDAVYRQNV